MLWLCVRSPYGVKAPSWKRSIAINRDGTVFVAAAVAGKEKEVSISTLTKPTSVLICFDHVYVPMAWMVENFPTSKVRCRDMASAALSGLQKTLACRDAWSQVSCFFGRRGEKSYLRFVP
ncbi:hypothetical protein [Pseudomonas sp. DTU12.3]|uniref:hypothetical protein n=1 Tax=Pseudomonas sp. DTU12.3 TaxID=2073078 RepID=UPI001010C6C8|nr:hypothetical protein [Pseudomonas sp. DTU12.3]